MLLILIDGRLLVISSDATVCWGDCDAALTGGGGGEGDGGIDDGGVASAVVGAPASLSGHFEMKCVTTWPLLFTNTSPRRSSV